MEEWSLSMEIGRIFLRWKDERNCSMTCWVSVDLPGRCRKERGGGIREANSLLTRISIRKHKRYVEFAFNYVFFQLGMSVLDGILPGVWKLDKIGMLCITSLFPKVVDTLANVYGQWSMGGGAKQEQHSVSRIDLSKVDLITFSPENCCWGGCQCSFLPDSRLRFDEHLWSPTDGSWKNTSSGLSREYGNLFRVCMSQLSPLGSHVPSFFQ